MNRVNLLKVNDFEPALFPWGRVRDQVMEKRTAAAKGISLRRGPVLSYLFPVVVVFMREPGVRQLRDKIREKHLRRLAREKGFALVRARTLNRRLPHYGTYALIDAARGTLLLAEPDTRYGITLEEIEQFLGEVAEAGKRARAPTAPSQEHSADSVD